MLGSLGLMECPRKLGAPMKLKQHAVGLLNLEFVLQNRAVELLLEDKAIEPVGGY